MKRPDKVVELSLTREDLKIVLSQMLVADGCGVCDGCPHYDDEIGCVGEVYSCTDLQDYFVHLLDIS